MSPGFFATPLVLESVAHTERLWAAQSAETRAQYGESFFQSLRNSTADAGRFSGDPAIVVNDLCHAVSAVRPRQRYTPGLDATYVFVPLSFCPQRIYEPIFALLSWTKGMVLANPPSAGLGPASKTAAMKAQ